MTDPPKRRLHLVLDLGADSLDDLADELRLIGVNLANDGREDRDLTSGGWAAGFHLTLTCDPEQTEDRFREQLEAWRQEKVAEAGRD